MDAFMCYGPVVPDGYGVCYNPHPDYMVVCVASFRSWPGTDSKTFADSLVDSLRQMRDLCTTGRQWTPHDKHTGGRCAGTTCTVHISSHSHEVIPILTHFRYNTHQPRCDDTLVLWRDPRISITPWYTDASRRQRSYFRLNPGTVMLLQVIRAKLTWRAIAAILLPGQLCTACNRIIMCLEGAPKFEAFVRKTSWA